MGDLMKGSQIGSRRRTASQWLMSFVNKQAANGAEDKKSSHNSLTFASASDCLLIYMSILFSMWKKRRDKNTEKKTRSDELLREGSDGKFNDFKLITSWWFHFVDASLASPKSQALTNTVASSITSNRSLLACVSKSHEKTSFAETFSCDSFQLLIFSHRNQSLIPIFSGFFVLFIGRRIFNCNLLCKKRKKYNSSQV